MIFILSIRFNSKLRACDLECDKLRHKSGCTAAIIIVCCFCRAVYDSYLAIKIIAFGYIPTVQVIEASLVE